MRNTSNPMMVLMSLISFTLWISVLWSGRTWAREQDRYRGSSAGSMHTERLRCPGWLVGWLAHVTAHLTTSRQSRAGCAGIWIG